MRNVEAIVKINSHYIICSLTAYETQTKNRSTKKNATTTLTTYERNPSTKPTHSFTTRTEAVFFPPVTLSHSFCLCVYLGFSVSFAIQYFPYRRKTTQIFISQCSSVAFFIQPETEFTYISYKRLYWFLLYVFLRCYITMQCNGLCIVFTFFMAFLYTLASSN